MSPEVFYKIKTKNSDIWSFGATIIEMVIKLIVLPLSKCIYYYAESANLLIIQNL